MHAASAGRRNQTGMAGEISSDRAGCLRCDLPRPRKATRRSSAALMSQCAVSQSVTAGGQVGQDSAPISTHRRGKTERQGAVSARMMMRACVFQKTWAANAQVARAAAFTAASPQPWALDPS